MGVAAKDGQRSAGQHPLSFPAIRRVDADRLPALPGGESIRRASVRTDDGL